MTETKTRAMKTEASDPIAPATFVSNDQRFAFPGLTKREYMSTAIYAAMMAIPERHNIRKMDAEIAVQYADALIEALNKGGGE